MSYSNPSFSHAHFSLHCLKKMLTKCLQKDGKESTQEGTGGALDGEREKSE